MRDAPGSLLTLARNPYMLTLLRGAYRTSPTGELPANRGSLFEIFVERLLLREKKEALAYKDEMQTLHLTAKGIALFHALESLAFAMQTRQSTIQDEEGVVVAFSTDEVVPTLLSENQLAQAKRATILSESGGTIRFVHQLLQEYFAARYLKREIAKVENPLEATAIWSPEKWWERTGWEESTILLAGLYSNDCTPALEWVADANPEVAGRCIARSGAHTPPTTKAELQKRWLPRLTNLQMIPIHTPALSLGVGWRLQI